MYRHGAKENATIARPELTCVAIAAPRRHRGYIALPRLQARQRRALTELPSYLTRASTAPKGEDKRRSLVKLRGSSAARTKAHRTLRCAPLATTNTCGPYIAQTGMHSPRTLKLTTWQS